jgi:hypothetical protein
MGVRASFGPKNGSLNLGFDRYVSPFSAGMKYEVSYPYPNSQRPDSTTARNNKGASTTAESLVSHFRQRREGGAVPSAEDKSLDAFFFFFLFFCVVLMLSYVVVLNVVAPSTIAGLSQ